MEAQIILEYCNPKTAKTIAKAISPDNSNSPQGLEVITCVKKHNVITQIICHKELPTFIATIDDLLFCTTTAEKTILSLAAEKK